MNQINVFQTRNITMKLLFRYPFNEDDLNPVVATTLKGNMASIIQPPVLTILYDILLLPQSSKTGYLHNARGSRYVL